MEGMLDANGRVIEDGPEPRPSISGDTRTFRVWLDCNQYFKDMENAAQGKQVQTKEIIGPLIGGYQKRHSQHQ